MATAEEILATMEEVNEQSVLEIESDLRTIKIPGDIKILGVESDDDVFRLHFKMPKMYGEVDLSEFALRINYMNAKQEGDVYQVTDAKVEDDVIGFSWLVGRHAAKYKGSVRFIVCAKLTDSSGIVVKEFNTTTAALPVLEGLETGEEVVQSHPDIIESILLRLDNIEKNGGLGQELDPTVPAWAKQPEKPTYTAGEVGADPKGTAETKVSEHNVDKAAHEDIRQLIVGLTNRLNAIADSDDTTLDQLSEIVAYIKSNKSLIDAITTGKVSTSDIVDNLTTNVGTKVLSAAQGVALKGLIDGVVGQLNEQKEAIDAQDEAIAGKANDKDLAAVAKSGSYNDLSNRPTIPTVPNALKNPNALTFTGAVSATYDGSAPVSVEIPAGGGGGNTGGDAEWRLIKTITVPATAAEGASGVNWVDMSAGGVLFGFDTDNDGNPFSISDFVIEANVGIVEASNSINMETDSSIPEYFSGFLPASINKPPKNGLQKLLAYGIHVKDNKYFTISTTVSGGEYKEPMMDTTLHSVKKFPITKMRFSVSWTVDKGFYPGSTFNIYGR